MSETPHNTDPWSTPEGSLNEACRINRDRVRGVAESLHVSAILQTRPERLRKMAAKLRDQAHKLQAGIEKLAVANQRESQRRKKN